MAAVRASLWEPGQTLRIAFRGGRRADRNAVLLAASKWMRLANIKIIPVNTGAAELRCSFDPIGSWSFVGRDCLAVDPNSPTLNMGWPDDPGRDLHELGHALGLIHEHQSPAAGIPWNRPAVYAWYASTQGWSRAEIDAQVFEQYNAATITNTAWDKYSIMEYPIPAELLTDPSFAVGWNQALSPTDIAFISSLYPKA
jgi:hypothetical protein